MPFPRPFLFLGLLLGLLACERQPRTPNGHAYRFHSDRPGPAAQAGDEVLYHIELLRNDTLLQSTHFEGKPSRYLLPAYERPEDVPPVAEALLLMSEGDSLSLFVEVSKLPVPPDAFQPDERMHYRLNMLAVETPAEREAARAAVQARLPEVEALMARYLADYRSGALDSLLLPLAEGLRYLPLRAGEGAVADSGRMVRVHYAGQLLADGRRFDASFLKGEAFAMQVGSPNIIAGWNLGLPMLREGGSALLFVPYGLAYGKMGLAKAGIPEAADLCFYVELERVY